jgi:hypothetical protein
VQPYVICKGDYLLKVAFEKRFDADAAWASAKNADLQTQRKDPNILAPGDVLFIPDAQDGPEPKSIEAGSTSTFVSPAPPTLVTVKFSDSGLASQPCTIAELVVVVPTESGESRRPQTWLVAVPMYHRLQFTGSASDNVWQPRIRILDLKRCRET